jgi:hypothetical protein
MNQPLLYKNKDVIVHINDNDNDNTDDNTDNNLLRLKIQNDSLKLIVKTFQYKIIPILILFTIYTIIFSGIFIVMILTYKK